MDSKIVPLRGSYVPGRPVTAVIEGLEEALVAARSGELIGVAVVRYNRDRSTGFALGGEYHEAALIGELQVAAAWVTQNALRRDAQLRGEEN